jgi:anti-anti-sigma factor
VIQRMVWQRESREPTQVQISRYPVVPVTILELKSEITLNNVDATQAQVAPLVSISGARVILDLSQVEIITTPGLGMLLQLNRDAQLSDAKLILACPRPMVHDTILRTQLDRVLKVVGTLDEAKALAVG